MKKSVRSYVVLALGLALTGAMAFAVDGSVYKAKCASCHGAAGVPNPGIAKVLGVKPVSDPATKALSQAQVAAVAKNGKGKMHPVAGISDADATVAAAFFKSLQ